MNRWICRDLRGLRGKLFYYEMSCSTEDGESLLGYRGPFRVNNKKEMGKYIRNNWPDVFDSLIDCLCYEMYWYNDQCMYAGEGTTNGRDRTSGEGNFTYLFDLPKTLIDIFEQRLNNGEERFSDYKYKYNFHDDLAKLSDEEVFDLLEQDCEMYDDVGGTIWYSGKWSTKE